MTTPKYKKLEEYADKLTWYAYKPFQTGFIEKDAIVKLETGEVTTIERYFNVAGYEHVKVSEFAYIQEYIEKLERENELLKEEAVTHKEHEQQVIINIDRLKSENKALASQLLFHTSQIEVFVESKTEKLQKEIESLKQQLEEAKAEIGVLKSNQKF